MYNLTATLLNEMTFVKSWVYTEQTKVLKCGYQVSVEQLLYTTAKISKHFKRYPAFLICMKIAIIL